jgi:hypothetical protein
VRDRAEPGEEVKRSEEMEVPGMSVAQPKEYQYFNSAAFMLSISCYSERIGGMPTHIYAL